jgi:DNA-binding GntR family transcriptional regulator
MRKETLAEQAYRVIKEKIVYCEWKFGEEIDQRMLAKELGFNSITPVREALILLQNEKLVNIIPRKGMLVSDVSISDVLENYQLREIIEPTVFEVTALDVPPSVIEYFYDLFHTIEESLSGGFDLKQYLQTDMDFHLCLLHPLNNHNLDTVLRGLYEQNARYRMACLQIRPAEVMLGEHLDILNALKKKDRGSAVEALKKHIFNSKRAFLNGGHQFIHELGERV